MTSLLQNLVTYFSGILPDATFNPVTSVPDPSLPASSRPVLARSQGALLGALIAPLVGRSPRSASPSPPWRQHHLQSRTHPPPRWAPGPHRLPSVHREPPAPNTHSLPRQRHITPDARVEPGRVSPPSSAEAIPISSPRSPFSGTDSGPGPLAPPLASSQPLRCPRVKPTFQAFAVRPPDRPLPNAPGSARAPLLGGRCSGETRSDHTRPRREPPGQRPRPPRPGQPEAQGKGQPRSRPSPLSTSTLRSALPRPGRRPVLSGSLSRPPGAPAGAPSSPRSPEAPRRPRCPAARWPPARAPRREAAPPAEAAPAALTWHGHSARAQPRA